MPAAGRQKMWDTFIIILYSKGLNNLNSIVDKKENLKNYNNIITKLYTGSVCTVYGIYITYIGWGIRVINIIQRKRSKSKKTTKLFTGFYWNSVECYDGILTFEMMNGSVKFISGIFGFWIFVIKLEELEIWYKLMRSVCIEYLAVENARENTYVIWIEINNFCKLFSCNITTFSRILPEAMELL